MKFVRFLIPLFLLLIASGAPAEYQFFNISETPALDSDECQVASSPNGVVVVAWDESDGIVWTRSVVHGALRPPVAHGPGRQPTVCWNPDGFTLAWGADDVVLIKSGNGESWSDMEFFLNPGGGDVIYPHLTGIPLDLPFSEVYLSWEEQGAGVWFARRLGGLWGLQEFVCPIDDYEWVQPQALPVPGIEEPFPRVYHLDGWDMDIHYWEQMGALWVGPFSVQPGMGYFGTDYECAAGPLTHHVFGMGPQPTCPCNVVHYSYQLSGGDWSVPEDLTVELDFYNWPQTPSLVVDLEGTVHAFWYQEYADEWMNPTGEVSYYKAKPIYGVWEDRSWLLEDQVGVCNDIMLDGDMNPVFVYATGDYPQREVWLGLDMTGTEAPASAAPLALSAQPNPFNPKTTIRYTLPEAGAATLAIYDVSGRRVATLADDFHAAGEHSLNWDGSDADGRALGSGLYLALVESAGRTQSEKLVLMK